MEHTQSLILKRNKSHIVSDIKEFLPLASMSKNKKGKLNTMVEKVLISRLIAGDKPAFSIIFNTYYNDLVMFAMSFIHNQNIAEEIVQDTFVTLWEDHDTYKITHSLKSYLLTIVRNKCIDWYRHEKIKQTHIDIVLEKSPCFACDTDNYLMFSELQEQFDIALDKLPDEISGPFRMNRNQGLKYNEIADILGVSVRTIEVRIGKALHLLCNYLKEYFMIILAFLYIFL